MSLFDEGVEHERQRIIDLLDQYDIQQLLGGAILMTPKTEPKPTWEGITHKTGSNASYSRGCRCVNCKAAQAEYLKQRLARLTDEQREELRKRKTELMQIRRRNGKAG